MSNKDVRRAQLLAQVASGERTLSSIAEVMEVSYRQAKRLYRRYREEGPAGLVHRNVGAPSHRRIEEEVRRKVIEAYRGQYTGFGPTFAAEKLRERDELEVDHETLRRWLMAEGLWSARRRGRHYRSRRERRHRFGELVQFDGSHHQWFEDRGEKCCLMNMVDDATGTTLACLWEKETTVAAMQLLWAWIERYGIPQAVYCDRKNAFVLDREPTLEEQLQGVTPKSHFQRACEELGIEVIVARSPQAKGRVERNHAVYQDRLVKELRLAGISRIEAANAFLSGGYLAKLNAKFAKPPIDSTDAHVALLPNQSLADILCFKEPRVVSNDYVVQFENRLFQIQRQKRRRLMSPGTPIEVHKWLDDSLHFFTTAGYELLVEEITHRPKKNEEDALSA
jgi:transposase